MESRHALTLRTALERYPAARRDLRPRSQDFYRHTVEKHLGDWLDLQLSAITGRHRYAKGTPNHPGGSFDLFTGR